MSRNLTNAEWIELLNAERKACDLLFQSHHPYAHSQSLACYRATKDAIKREGLTWVYREGTHVVYREESSDANNL